MGNPLWILDDTVTQRQPPKSKNTFHYFITYINYHLFTYRYNTYNHQNTILSRNRSLFQKPVTIPQTGHYSTNP